MAQVGKTSLAYQVIDRLPNALLAWVALDGPPVADLYGIIRRLWLDSARTRFGAWEHPPWEPSSAPPATNQIVDDLQALRARLIERDQPLDLVAVLDGMPDPTTGSEILNDLNEKIIGGTTTVMLSGETGAQAASIIALSDSVYYLQTEGSPSAMLQ